MTPQFSSKALGRLCLIRVKVERTKKHLSDLEKELITFRDSSYAIVVAELDPETEQPIRGRPHQFLTLPHIPFDVLPAIGDIMHNLRSALDHLAYQLVMVGTHDKGPTHPRRIHFPIAKDAATYESEKHRQVEGMADNAKLAIDLARPYKGGNDAFWTIHSLNNADKHRNLLTVGQDYLFFADWLPFGFPYWHKAEHPDFSGIFDNGPEQEIEAEVERAVSKMQAADKNALLPALHQLVNFVDNFILSFQSLLEEE